MTVINTADIERFFDFLSPSKKEIFSGWCCNKEGDRPIADLGFVYEPREKLLELASAVYEGEEGSLHICLNRTSDRGRGIKEVQGVRVLCVDLDNITPVETIKRVRDKFDIQMIVESSPGKYHLYWKISSEIPKEVWSDFQSGLAFGFAGDTNLNQLNRTIRVPGVPRLTKSGEEYIPRVVFLKENLTEHNFNSIGELFPDLSDWIESAKELEKERRLALKKTIKLGKMNPERAAILGESRNRTIFDYVVHKVMSRYGREPKNPMSWEEALACGIECADMFPQNGKPPLDEKEIEKASSSGFRYGTELAVAEKDKKDEGVKKGKQKQSEVEFKYDYSTMGFLSMYSEFSVVERFHQRFGESMLRVRKLVYAFDPANNTWHVQNSQDQSHLLQGFMKQVVKDILNEPEFLESECCNSKGEYSDAAHKNAKNRFSSVSLAEKVCRSMIRHPKLATVNFDAFDSNPAMVFCGNGALDMRTGELRAPKPTDYMLNRTKVNYNPDAKCPEFRKFLREVFDENQEPEAMVKFTQELFGYSISGLINAQKIFCHYGDGCNGKSKVLTAINAICGDYATSVDPDDIVTKKGAYAKAMERIGAKIEGHRAVIVDDISVSTVWNEAFVKNLTGPVIRARAEHEQSREFRNRASIHLGLNNPPNPEGENEGIIRRICLIPYVRQFTHDSKTSDAIDAMIESEKEGILAWAVRGFQRYVAHGGFKYPSEIELAVEEYRERFFTWETVVTELFRMPTEQEIAENKAPYLFLADLVQEVNLTLKSEGRFESVSPEQLGIALKRKFKSDSKKIRHPQKGNAFKAYRVMRQYDAQKLIRAGHNLV